ncbi:MAG TPA: Ger(x)C family spore germination C-terminal domain-containing protein, partial [Desulfobacteria bacterium]|nr:Ger(x)C family spore germination C-terminal domain-containing protein [Desulfobacteria bacterium]
MRKIIGLAISCVIIFTTIGCWDLRGISNRAFITAIALDASDKGYKVGFLIPKPARIRIIDRELISVHQTVEAESISKAAYILQTELSREVNFSHLRVLIIGEKIAREKNFNDLINFFYKDPAVAMRFKLVFIEGNEAHDVLDNMPVLDRSIASDLVGLAAVGEKLGLTRLARFADFLGDLRASDGTALGTRIINSKKGNEDVTARLGGAIYNHWRLAGWLNADEIQAANWLISRNPESLVVCKLGRGQYSYKVETKDVKITPKVTDGRLAFKVRIKTVGGIAEQEGSSLDLSEPRNLNRLEEVFTRKIRSQALSAVN